MSESEDVCFVEVDGLPEGAVFAIPELREGGREAGREGGREGGRERER